jgi:hypothetical protein
MLWGETRVYLYPLPGESVRSDWLRQCARSANHDSWYCQGPSCYMWDGSHNMNCLLVTVAGIVEPSVLNVPPHMRSMHASCSVLRTFAAHGIMSQSSLQELGPSVPVLDDTGV